MREEECLQIACVDYLRKAHKTVRFTISPIVKLSKYQAAKVVRMGYMAGTPDIMIFAPRHGFKGLFVELKVQGRKLSKVQEAYGADLINEGYQWLVIRSIDDFINKVGEYLRK